MNVYTAGDEGDAGVDNTGYSEDGSTMYDSAGEPSTQLHNTHQALSKRPDPYGESGFSLQIYTPQLTESDSPSQSD